MSRFAMKNESPTSVQELEERLSEPTERVLDAFRRLPGDLLILGVGGKMGPTLARMARRAADIADEGKPPRRIIGVSRFTSKEARASLETHGVETIAGDLLDARFVASLPEAPLVVQMTGYKFGTASDPSMTWAVNCISPALVCRRFAESRIAAFSTGNVYGLTSATGQGSRESDPLRPDGEYSMAAVGRERLLDYFGRREGVRLAILRLNYAVEMRYGVLVDLARRVLAGEEIDVSMGSVNVIWQADASAMALASLAHASSPALIVNLAGPEILRVRDVCQELGKLMNKEPHFSGREAPDALLSDGRKGHELFGPPRVAAGEVIRWTAEWLLAGGETLNKPTHFQTRDGKF
jgi:nucleoside-diphosphate-sugar epimerase